MNKSKNSTSNIFKSVQRFFQNQNVNNNFSIKKSSDNDGSKTVIEDVKDDKIEDGKEKQIINLETLDEKMKVNIPNDNHLEKPSIISQDITNKEERVRKNALDIINDLINKINIEKNKLEQEEYRLFILSQEEDEKEILKEITLIKADINELYKKLLVLKNKCLNSEFIDESKAILNVNNSLQYLLEQFENISSSNEHITDIVDNKIDTLYDNNISFQSLEKDYLNANNINDVASKLVNDIYKIIDSINKQCEITTYTEIITKNSFNFDRLFSSLIKFETVPLIPKGIVGNIFKIAVISSAVNDLFELNREERITKTTIITDYTAFNEQINNQLLDINDMLIEVKTANNIINDLILTLKSLPNEQIKDNKQYQTIFANAFLLMELLETNEKTLLGYSIDYTRQEKKCNKKIKIIEEREY